MLRLDQDPEGARRALARGGDWALSYADRVLALNYGRVVACGTCEEVQAHPDVVKAYLGG